MLLFNSFVHALLVKKVALFCFCQKERWINGKQKQDLIIPQNKIELLAIMLSPYILKYFETEQGKKEFNDWIAKLRNEK